jgi:hypothetical protein
MEYVTRSPNPEGPEGAFTELANRVEGHILCRLSGQILDLQVIERAGGLVLRGHTHTYYAKQLAQHAAMEISNLPTLANEIEVR